VSSYEARVAETPWLKADAQESWKYESSNVTRQSDAQRLPLQDMTTEQAPGQARKRGGNGRDSDRVIREARACVQANEGRVRDEIGEAKGDHLLVIG
jgi:hypothetical protein